MEYVRERVAPKDMEQLFFYIKNAHVLLSLKTCTRAALSPMSLSLPEDILNIR